MILAVIHLQIEHFCNRVLIKLLTIHWNNRTAWLLNRLGIKGSEVQPGSNRVTICCNSKNRSTSYKVLSDAPSKRWNGSSKSFGSKIFYCMKNIANKLTKTVFYGRLKFWSFGQNCDTIMFFIFNVIGYSIQWETSLYFVLFSDFAETMKYYQKQFIK